MNRRLILIPAFAGLVLVAGLAAWLAHRPATLAARPAVRPSHVASRSQAVRRALLPPLPSAELAALHADEAGRIPILMYHAVGGPAHRGARYDTQGLNIAPETFRKQLDLMYAAQWYPVNMRDVLTSRLDVPAGKTPVVLTFDDARGSQFRYGADGQTDPNCAVGILEDFHARHPDWPLRATFYVLPKSAWNPVPFWQPGTETQKLRALVADGFEVANHTTTHRMLGRLPASELCWEMAEAQRYVHDRAPSATMDTMALPGGDAPRNHALWAYLRAGRLGKITYHTRCILMAWGGPSHAWVDRKFDSDRVTRTGSGPGWIERLLKQMKSGRIRPYISDGNPDTVSVPRSEAHAVDPRRLEGARLVIYDDGTKKAAPHLLAASRSVGRHA